jgi:hypothetical protein
MVAVNAAVELHTEVAGRYSISAVKVVIESRTSE